MTHEHMLLWFPYVQGDAECEARKEACEAEAACLEGDNECIAAARGTLWSPMTVSVVLISICLMEDSMGSARKRRATHARLEMRVGFPKSST